ncbi:MAG: DegV family protein [Filifactor alocis]|nr:DegV family protein [Filifactor alocis]
MNKIAIITDSTNDLHADELKACPNLFVVPMLITYNDERQFRDGVDKDAVELTKDLDEFRPKTSSPLGEDFVHTYNRLLEEGYTHVIGVFLSEGISGTYKSAISYAEFFADKGIETEILNSKGVSMVMGHTVRVLSKKAMEGMSFEELVQTGQEMLDRTSVYFAVESLKYLIRGGRIPKVEGTLGEMLDIKPIIGVTEEGTLHNVAKVRGRKRSIKKVAEMFAQEASRRAEHIFVVHGQRPEDADYLKSLLEEQCPGVKAQVHELSALLTCHTGPGTIGAVIFWE